MWQVSCCKRCIIKVVPQNSSATAILQAKLLKEFVVKLLALDTSTEACSVALWLDGQLSHLDEVCPQQHSKRILPMIDQLLVNAGVRLQQLDGLVFGRGPGSFTGVRIGVGVAQGLAFAADLPVYGVSTLQAMAQAAFRQTQQTQVVAAIDARMAEVYIAQYQYDTDSGLMLARSAEVACKPEQLPPLVLADVQLLVGTGAQTYPSLLQSWAGGAPCSAEILLPAARDMLSIAQPAFARGDFVAAEHAEPVYVRDEVTWQKLPGR